MELPNIAQTTSKAVAFANRVSTILLIALVTFFAGVWVGTDLIGRYHAHQCTKINGFVHGEASFTCEVRK